tara:strand:+ start:388 stop:954 length:567 start_codon:yes stop_codon:yes gene_type:complete
MVNYANGKVYKIESSLGDKIYIGSTTKAQLSQRMSTHRADYKRWKDGKRGAVSSFQLFEEYGLENCKIVLLEDCPCETNDQLKAREAHYIRTLECVNKFVPLRTKKEYDQENKEKKKAYLAENKDRLSARKKAYRSENKDRISARMREYHAENRDEINAKKIEFYEENKEKILARNKAYRDAKKSTAI